MAEDSRDPPLPRRVPGDRRKPGTGPAAPLVLPESVIQRIRAALDAVGDEASPQEDAARTEQPASLPERVPGANNGPAPPEEMARPQVPASLLRSQPDEASTDEFPAVPAYTSSGVAGEIGVQPDITGPPAAAPPPAASTSSQPTPVQRPAAPSGLPAAVQVAQDILAPLSRPQERAHRSRGFIGAAIAVLVLVSAGSAAFLLTRHSGTARTAGQVTAANPATGASAEVAIRHRAAAWVASQVSRGARISCDRAMCRELKADHVPAADLRVLRLGRAQQLRSGVVVATAEVGRIVGSRVLTDDAPATIASFGSGSMRISVQVIFSRGAAAYLAALHKDMATRKSYGNGLLQFPRITVSSTARRQLVSGQVDSRLVLTIASVAAQWPVSIAAFGDRAPGASPGIPFRCAYFVETGGHGASQAAQARSISGFLHAQGSAYPCCPHPGGAILRPERSADGVHSAKPARVTRLICPVTLTGSDAVARLSRSELASPDRCEPAGLKPSRR